MPRLRDTVLVPLFLAFSTLTTGNAHHVAGKVERENGAAVNLIFWTSDTGVSITVPASTEYHTLKDLGYEEYETIKVTNVTMPPTGLDSSCTIHFDSATTMVLSTGDERVMNSAQAVEEIMCQVYSSI